MTIEWSSVWQLDTSNMFFLPITCSIIYVLGLLKRRDLVIFKFIPHMFEEKKNWWYVIFYGDFPLDRPLLQRILGVLITCMNNNVSKNFHIYAPDNLYVSKNPTTKGQHTEYCCLVRYKGPLAMWKRSWIYSSYCFGSGINFSNMVFRLVSCCSGYVVVSLCIFSKNRVTSHGYMTQAPEPLLKSNSLACTSTTQVLFANWTEPLLL